MGSGRFHFSPGASLTMKNKYIFVPVLLAVILLAGTGLTFIYAHRNDSSREETGLKVVTSFYPMYIAAENIIGDCEGVTLQNLSEPQTGCLHDYQLTSEDMKLLSSADVFIVNGGGIESFLADIADEYPDLAVVTACDDLELQEDNAHAWMSMQAYMVQVQTISNGLCGADPDHAERYRQNADDYVEKVQALREEYRDVAGGLEGLPVVLFHEAYEYVADEYGMVVAGLMDLDEERQVSAGEVSDILSVIEESEVSVILAEELYGKDMGDMMENETDVTVVYLDTLTRGDYSPDSYLEGMRSNLELLHSICEK